MKHARTTAVVVATITATTLAACSSSKKSASESSVSPAAAGSSAAAAAGPDSLAGVCPATVVVQQDWEPEAEHAGLYALVGPGYTIDRNKKRVTGPLVIDGKDTGVKIQVRAGGAGVGYQGPNALLYVDKSITLGAISTDGAVGTSADQPVTAVVAQLNKSPQILMWDPKSHPDWTGIADIAKTDAKVVVSKGAAYVTWLEQKGLIKSSQVDQGYTGAPARFVSDPKIAQQGFATAEPYIYQNEIKQWGKPVKYQLLADVGYTPYPEALSVRTGDLPALSPCLKKLVPIFQRGQIAYIKNPGPTNELITKAVEQYNDGWTYSIGVADYAAQAMKDLSIVTNDSSGPFGAMDMSRVQSTIDTFGPILQKDGSKVKPGLKAADIATDEFIDPTITLS